VPASLQSPTGPLVRAVSASPTVDIAASTVLASAPPAVAQPLALPDNAAAVRNEQPVEAPPKWETRTASGAADALAAIATARDRDIADERSARRLADAALSSLERLGKFEDRDVSASARAIRDRLERAQAETAAGRHDRAAALAREGSAMAVRMLNGFIGELVSDYRRVEEEAKAAGELEIASQALQRARAVSKQRR
jgi:hypothetical protein